MRIFLLLLVLAHLSLQAHTEPVALSCPVVPEDEWPALEEEGMRLEQAGEYGAAIDLLRTSPYRDNPDIAFSIALLTQAVFNSTALPSVARRESMRLYWHAARCGLPQAVIMLADVYESGTLGAGRNLDISSCLRNADRQEYYDAEGNLPEERIAPCHAAMQSADPASFVHYSPPPEGLANFCSPEPPDFRQVLDHRIEPLKRQGLHHEILILLRDATNNVDPEIQFELARLTEAGFDANLSKSEARKASLDLYWHAAICGEPRAVTRLAEAYKTGDLGAPRNDTISSCLGDAAKSDHRGEDEYVPGGRVETCRGLID